MINKAKLAKYRGFASYGPSRHNEYSRTIELDGKWYNISSRDNDRQMSMTDDEQMELARKRGYGKGYNTLKDAVEAAENESREWGKDSKFIESYLEHRGKT